MARIVNREEFLKMPVGTIYQFYSMKERRPRPGIAVKNWLYENDWGYEDLDLEGALDWPRGSYDSLREKLEEAESDSSLSLATDFDCGKRDGGYDPDDMFIVFEGQDALSLIQRLQKALDQSREASGSGE